MRRRVLRAFGCFGLVALLSLALPSLWVVREYRRDPLPLLDRPVEALRLRSAETSVVVTASGETRRLLELEFDGAPEGPVRAALSLPAANASRLPVVVILGGLEVGRDSLRYVEVHGANALLAYAYPRPSQDLYEGKPLFKLSRIRRASLAVPAQIRALLAWAAAQPWADPERISLLGYSFGAIFVPASARVAERHGIRLRALVMAYGGADLPALLAANASLRPDWLRPLAARAVGAVVRPLEPALHLPHLHGEALFLNGRQDHRVPLACARLMHSLKPPPKTVIELEAGHMDPSRPELNRRIVAASKDWLIARGAMAP